ncbi:MAG: DUF2306 domain-containing protein [Ekhidna sp.]
MKVKKTIRILLIILIIIIGLYPFSFLFTDAEEGFISMKKSIFTPGLLWYGAFYTHILLGGVALLIGWPQFLKKLRNKNIALHRTLGKIYLMSIFFSSIAGFYMAVLANGGLIAKIGFSLMAIAWMFTTVKAYTTIRKRDVEQHQQWMIRSYALTLAGVTFRLWLPLLLFGFQLDFIIVYRIDAWVSWVLNLVVAELIIRKALSRRLKMESV